MKGFEDFRPLLRKGRLIPQGSRVIYETAEPFQQIVLPIAASEFLVLCDGNNTMRDIVRQLYQKNGTVHFKTLFKIILLLHRQGYFANGKELPYSKSWAAQIPRSTAILGQPLWHLNLGQRILNDRTYPVVFYILAMSSLILAIFGLQLFSGEVASARFLRWEGSYFSGLIFFFVCSSLFLSAKNIFKTFLLLTLTGRAYNFRITFSGVTLYFNVGSESLELVTDKLYLTIFHLASATCYFSLLMVSHWLFKLSPELMSQALLVALLLLVLDFDPFRPSEITKFFKGLMNDEALIRLSHYLKSRSVIALLNPEHRENNHNLFLVFSHLALLWAVLGLAFIYRLLSGNYRMLEYSLLAEPWLEKISGLAIYAALVFLSVRILNDLAETFYNNVLLPLDRRVRHWLRRKNTKADRLHTAASDEILVKLACLPLFSYFSRELLSQILSQSQVEAVPTGNRIIVQGEVGQDLFVLLEGCVRVKKRDTSGLYQRVAEVLPISIFGEVAVMGDGHRTAEVLATEPSVVLRIPVSCIHQAAQETKYMSEITTFKNAVMVNQYFASAPLFRDLPHETAQAIMAKAELVQFKPNEIVFLEGSRGDAVYLLVRGSVEVLVEGRIINHIRQGGFFGEISVMADVPRTATVRAQDDITLLKIGTADFWDLLSESLDLALFIESVGEMRLREEVRWLEAIDVSK